MEWKESFRFFAKPKKHFTDDFVCIIPCVSSRFDYYFCSDFFKIFLSIFYDLKFIDFRGTGLLLVTEAISSISEIESNKKSNKSM